MIKRRLLGVAVVLALLDPLAVFATLKDADHECSDHVCACARTARQHCHESEGETPGMQASCNHDAASWLSPVTPAVLTLEPSLGVPVIAESTPPPAPERRLAGFSRIDPPPPRGL